MPSKSPEKFSDDSFDKELRSRHIRIERRPSIRDSSPYPDEENNSREFSRSPVRKDKNLYPDLTPLKDQNKNPSESPNKNKSSPKLKNAPIHNDDPSNSNILLISIIVLVILLFAVIVGVVFKTRNSNTTLKSNKQTTYVDCSQFMGLENKFPNQDAKLFKSLKIGIESIYNRDPSKNSVVTFFSTDENLLNSFITDVVKIARKCINQTFEPINLTHTELNKERFLNDYTLIVGDYKEELNKRSILVVNNIERLSTKIVPSLHAFADTYNPLVAKSLIYLTVKVPEKPVGKSIDYIYHHLVERWSDLESNIREPLITRLIDQTFFIKPLVS